MKRFLILALLFVFVSAITIPSSYASACGQSSKTYYIYSYDGKLLAEYNEDNQCIREYIYLENKLFAEYRPQSDKYFYYTNDQINSTRVVTDEDGNVVYSATYSPFGKKIQSSQTVDEAPNSQFSGKEREERTSLDYFGARYYDHSTYRFNSTDPIVNKSEAILNPQLWNLYSYCHNNPITYFDPDGREEIGTIVDVMTDHNNELYAGRGFSIKSRNIRTNVRMILGGIATALLFKSASAEIIAAVTGPYNNGGNVGDIDAPPPPKEIREKAMDLFNNPDESPGEGWSKANEYANWHNKETGDSLRPDLNHPVGKAPHVDYMNKKNSEHNYRIFKDGTWEAKKKR